MKELQSNYCLYWSIIIFINPIVIACNRIRTSWNCTKPSWINDISTSDIRGYKGA
ncbi:hypothetical protein P3L10_007131 [Capsicum annuum]